MPAIDRQHRHPVLPQWHRRPLRLRTVRLDTRKGRGGRGREIGEEEMNVWLNEWLNEAVLVGRQE
jgi:hypothetical protein